MSARHLVRALALAVLVTLATSLVRRSVTEYQGWDCPPGVRACPHPVAARGAPLPYVVDREFLSPTPNVDLVGALMGLDSFRFGPFAANVATWLLVVLGAGRLVKRSRARRPDA